MGAANIILDTAVHLSRTQDTREKEMTKGWNKRQMAWCHALDTIHINKTMLFSY